MVVWQCVTLVKEPILKTTEGARKPDLLITTNGKTYCLDFQVVIGRFMQRNNIAKVNKYRNIVSMDDIIKRKCASRAVEYHAVTIPYKRLIERNTSKLLDKLQFKEQLRLMMVTPVLRGT